ncbi:MAG: sigma-70 family RNA polymerase sigma factor [Acidobacteriota bacterium]
MKKVLNISDSDSFFREQINSNLEYINKQCLKTVKLKSGGFLKGELNVENEADRLFNRVLDKLTENDFGILRRFEGRSKLTTYLTTIIVRTAIDMIRERAGRERPETDSGSSRSGKVPDAEGTPVKNGIRSGEAGGYFVPDENNIPELRVIGTDRELKMGKVISVMLSSLNGEEKLLLRMKFPADPEMEPMSTSEISTALRISAKGVYNRIERLIKKCRIILENEGIGEQDFILTEFKGNVRHMKRRE